MYYNPKKIVYMDSQESERLLYKLMMDKAYHVLDKRVIMTARFPTMQNQLRYPKSAYTNCNSVLAALLLLPNTSSCVSLAVGATSPLLLFWPPLLAMTFFL